jgi:hypothetical protein
MTMWYSSRSGSSSGSSGSSVVYQALFNTVPKAKQRDIMEDSNILLCIVIVLHHLLFSSSSSSSWLLLVAAGRACGGAVGEALLYHGASTFKQW